MKRKKINRNYFYFPGTNVQTQIKILILNITNQFLIYHIEFFNFAVFILLK